LMLNAVQTMDRFDDPKQKQILINVKEWVRSGGFEKDSPSLSSVF
jgi:hypothetical protein